MPADGKRPASPERWWLTWLFAADSNGKVADQARDSDADVLESGREPRVRRAWPGSLARVLVFAEAAILAASIAVALHYHAEAGDLRHRRPAAAAAPATRSLPQMSSLALRLPASGPVAGKILITAAAQPGANRAQFTVSALITGASPGTVYDLTGNDCSAAAPMPDHVWATGRTDAAGTADLAGHAWAGRITDEDWLALTPSPARPAPGLRGKFAQGKAAPFPAGQAPCAPPRKA
jgi:hypothetical protein